MTRTKTKTNTGPPMWDEPNGRYQLHVNPAGMHEMMQKTLAALALRDDYDTIYVSGNSGVVPGAIAAYTLGKKLMILRPKTSDAHGSMYVGDAWYDSTSRAILIDDFISSGETFTRMMEQATNHYLGHVVGTLLYGHHVTEWERTHGYIQTSGMLAESIALFRRGESPLFDIGRVVEEKDKPAPVVRTKAAKAAALAALYGAVVQSPPVAELIRSPWDGGLMAPEYMAPGVGKTRLAISPGDQAIAEYMSFTPTPTKEMP